MIWYENVVFYITVVQFFDYASNCLKYSSNGWKRSQRDYCIEMYVPVWVYKKVIIGTLSALLQQFCIPSYLSCALEITTKHQHACFWRHPNSFRQWKLRTRLDSLFQMHTNRRELWEHLSCFHVVMPEEKALVIREQRSRSHAIHKVLRAPRINMQSLPTNASVSNVNNTEVYWFI